MTAKENTATANIAAENRVAREIGVLLNQDSNNRLHRFLPGLAVAISITLYVVHSIWGAGSSHRILDSWAYLKVSSGESAGVPFDVRILEPWLAAQVASLTGLSVSAVFNILTPLALLGSLLILKTRMNRRGTGWEWQSAVLLAFGCSLAVTFGYTPILVDPFLLFVTCLTIATLDAGKLLPALALTSAAVLTKEFGLYLGPVWSFYAYLRGYRKFACAGVIVPVTTLVIVVLARHSTAAGPFLGWRPYAYHYLFDYQLSVFRLRGLTSYPQLLYMGAWCSVWPALLVATMWIRPHVIRSTNIDVDLIGFVVLLISLPLLLLGDWSRNLIVLVPFASMVAANHPLARDRYFVGLIALGGLTTALARPFHGDSPTPPPIVFTVATLSLISSILILIKIVRFRVYSSRPALGARIAEPAGGILVGNK